MTAPIRPPNSLYYRPPAPRPAPYSSAAVDYLMQEIERQRKPEPSSLTLARARAKGTPFEWLPVPPPSEALRREQYVKRYGVDLYGIPITPPRFVADDTAAPLTMALQRWLQGR